MITQKNVFMRALLSFALPLGLVALIVLVNRSSNAEQRPIPQASINTWTETYPDHSMHALWAAKVIEGGAILHLRHTQRARWTDVTTFDAIELYGEYDASKESFADATCLTPRGVEEAKMIGKVFSILDVNISSIYSSPSCRARQTAENAFGSEGEITSSLLHRTAISQAQHSEASKSLRKLLLGIEVEPGRNVVLSGHGGTLGYDGTNLIDEYNATVKIDDRKEGGFAVIEVIDGKIVVQHVFKTFSQFANEAIKLPIASSTKAESLVANAPGKSL